jgi:hypothetical protein
VDWRYKSIEVAKSERDISGEPYNYWSWRSEENEKHKLLRKWEELSWWI